MIYLVKVNTIIETLKKIVFDLNIMWSQGYDKAAESHGRFKGILLKIGTQKHYISTRYISQSLNLSLSDTAKTQGSRIVFGIINECYSFF